MESTALQPARGKIRTTKDAVKNNECEDHL